MAPNDSRDRVRRDTPFRLAFTLLGALATLTLPGTAHAQEWRDVAAHVVWVREPFVYLAADSAAVASGMPLRFVRGRRELAEAVVDRRLDEGLARARLTGGSLARETRLDRLRVLAGPVPVSPLASLRVGLPGADRATLLFTCRAPRPRPEWGGAHGRADSLGPGLWRLVRTAPPAAGVPETLWVRLFADAADEEIALERGELDVAVFWPGELSSRMRADARWREAPRVPRARGVLACTGARADSLAPDPAQLEALSREGFGGDLLPWPAEPVPGSSPPRLARVEPDPALPGAGALERLLARASGRGPALRLRLLDVAAADSAWRAPDVRPVFLLGCPVLVSPALRDAWPGREGAADLARLLRCGAGAP